MKDLDETIKDFEKAAEETEKDARFYSVSRPDKERKEYSIKKANANRQLAAWLKELKAFRSIKDQIAHVKRNIKSENSDYLTGYICALSVVEGMIADAKLKAEGGE